LSTRRTPSASARSVVSVEVDGRVPHPRRHQQAQVRQAREPRCGERRALPHCDNHVERSQRRDQGVIVGDVLAENAEPGPSGQPGPVGRGERHALIVIENGDVHRFHSPSATTGKSIRYGTDEDSMMQVTVCPQGRTRPMTPSQAQAPGPAGAFES
jgi:hypothetical protein